VERLPIHHHVDERHLIEKGLCNYWGYNTLAFFAPNVRLAHANLPHGHGPRVQEDGPIFGQTC